MFLLEAPYHCYLLLLFRHMKQDLAVEDYDQNSGVKEGEGSLQKQQGSTGQHCL